MNGLVKKLMQRWEVDSLWQVIVILIIFSITGFSTLIVKEFAFDLLGISDQTVWWIKAFFWLLIILPAYQFLFLIFGFLLGQFDFVWRFEKRTFGKLMKLVGSRPEQSAP